LEAHAQKTYVMNCLHDKQLDLKSDPPSHFHEVEAHTAILVNEFAEATAKL